MATYRLDIIASLARQMMFTPVQVRERQLIAAEELALQLESAKAYPPAYVVFQITGYKPKMPSQALLTGLAVQHDLGLLVEEVSAVLGQHTADRSEPVLGIDDVIAGFNVTSKTVQRWRRKGLVARRFIFPDGKRRIGFRLAVVEKFLAAHRSQVLHAVNASAVDDDEQAVILRNARRLATRCGCSADEIARRIARRLGRSPLTIEATLRKHDAEVVAEGQSLAILPAASVILTDVEKQTVQNKLDAGHTLAAVARAIGRRSPAVYRLGLAKRLARLTDRSMRFIDDPLYHEPDGELRLNELLQADIAAEQPRELSRMPADLPPYLRDLYRTPLLSPSRERALFLKFHFEKFQFVTARRHLDPALARVRDAVRLERLLAKLQATKNQIVQANLRLVVSVAKKHVRPGAELMELVSEGNLTLMRAVESFDVHKGNKFSTYATLALMKGYARTVPEMLADGGRTMPAGRIDQFACRSRGFEHVDTREDVDQLLACLDDQERDVLCTRFQLPAMQGVSEHLSPVQVSRIETTAIAKLRTLSPNR